MQTTPQQSTASLENCLLAERILFEGFAKRSISGRYDGPSNEYHPGKRSGDSWGSFRPDAQNLALAIEERSPALLEAARAAFPEAFGGGGGVSRSDVLNEAVAALEALR